MLHPRLVASGLLIAALGFGVTPVTAQEAAFQPGIEDVEDLPAGPGREETFYNCVACHAFRLVAQQGMSRERWDGTLDWMVERHGMTAIEGAERELILDYLAEHYPPRAPAARGGWRNPFLPN